MRAVDGPIFDIWNAGGPFVGPHRAAHGRVTVELGWTLKASSGNVGSIDPAKLPIRWYASTNAHVEKELPNVKMIETQRSIDTDAASCTVTIYNQQMSPSQDLELGNPGYFTFNRGAAGNRWSHAENDWSELLVPNALIRTYQGYGGHGLTIDDAVAAGNLVQTGVWLVDEVRITTQGTIELHMRDPVKLLMEQYCYIPLIPSTYYPLHYARFYNRRVENPYVAYGATAGHKKEIVGIEPGITDSRGNMGYWLVGDDGGVFTFGINYFEGGLDGSLTHTGIGIARNAAADGYWIAQINGTVSNFGGAPSLGSAADRPSDFVAIESVPYANGYYLLDAAGEVYSFGSVSYWGNAPGGGTYVAMAVHPNGNGYWILDSTGHVFTVGTDMDYYGNAPSAGRPFVGMCATVTGHGYWIVDDVGHVYAFGDAFYAGGTQDITLNDPITDVIEAPNGQGYWLVAQDGGVFTFGNIPFYGSLPGPNVNDFPFDGNFKDYSDVVKDLLLWAGFWLYPEVDSSNLPAVYGNIESTGAYPSGDPQGALPDDMFDKRPVLDAITRLKETVGYILWCDEEGAIHFESPNFWGPGNFLPDGGHVAFWPIIDERVDLITYGVSFNDKSVRSQIIISSNQPTANLAGTVTTTFTPTNADVLKGIVKPAMWVNENFSSAHDQLVMAELLGLQIWFQQRLGSVECAANPMIQVNDQVRIYERQTEEHYVHYVRTLETSHDLDTGEFRMNLTTHWMGDLDDWAIVRPG